MATFVHKFISVKSVYCTIITIGDELLIGQTIDTNSAWIAQQLNPLGIRIKRRLAVGDNKHDIIEALNQEINEVDIILLTGGLGPTSDDITKPLLCEYFGGTLIENTEVLEHVKAFFAKRNRPMLQSNLNQALLPDVCEVLFNAVGTAPGMLFKKGDCTVVSMPGVPYEMKHIMREHVLNKLKSAYPTTNFIHRTLLTSGQGESFVAEKLISFESTLPSSIKLAYLPKLGTLKLRLTGENIDEALIDQYFRSLCDELKDIYVAPYDTDLEHIIHEILTTKKHTVSTAESCTGGLIAASLTSLKGSSNLFKGGLISYATEIKTEVLGVHQTTIDQHQVVSQQVVLEMAENARRMFKTDYAISTSGYLEKGEHNNEVWIGIAGPNSSKAHQIIVPFDREKNAVLTVNTALNLLRLFILAN